MKKLFRLIAILCGAEFVWEFMAMTDYFYSTKGYNKEFDETNTTHKASAYMLNTISKKVHRLGLNKAWDEIVDLREEEHSSEEERLFS